MPKVELTLPNPKYWLIFCGGVGITGLLVAAGLYWGHVAREPKSLLPKSVIENISFVPYFFEGSIPEGYQFSNNNLAYSGGVLSIRLTKSGSQDITITEQALPDKLRQNDILGKGDKIDVKYGYATINNVEGRFLGTITSSDDKQTLILITSDNNGDRNSVVDFIKSLSRAK